MILPDTSLAQIEPHLRDELGDPATAASLARCLAEDVLSWRAPEIAPERITDGCSLGSERFAPVWLVGQLETSRNLAVLAVRDSIHWVRDGVADAGSGWICRR
ncbi:MAG TPA: hypothetical protein VND87_07680 [Stellaceae bacterium]|nr:hypothetical protein [Stellaceae bacterium]